MAVVDTILALVLVVQWAALHTQLAKAAMVTAVVEIAAPTVTWVAAAWSVVLIKLCWGWPPSVPAIFKLHWHWKSYQMTTPNDHWFCVLLLSLNKLFVKNLTWCSNSSIHISPSGCCCHAGRRRGGDPSLLKPRSNNDDNSNNNDDEDTVIASASKNHNDHNVIFFALVVVVVAAVDDGGTRPLGHPLMLMPLRVSCLHTRRRRGGDPLLSRLRSYNDNGNDDNDDDDMDAVIASASKNDDDHDIVFFAVISQAAERQQRRRLWWWRRRQGCRDFQREQEQCVATHSCHLGTHLCKPRYSDAFPHNVAWLLGRSARDWRRRKSYRLKLYLLIVETWANGSERAGGGVFASTR